MLNPIEIRVDGGRILFGPPSMVPSYRRAAPFPAAVLHRLFADGGAVMRLRALWPRLGLGGEHTQQLTPPELRRALDRALAAHRLAMLWVPQQFDRTPAFPVQPAKAAAPPPAAPAHPPGMPRPPAPRIAFDKLDAIDRIELALKKSFGQVRHDLKAEIAKLDAETILRGLAAFCVLVAVAQSGGPVAAALDAALLAYGYYLVGWNGLRAALEFGTASFEALNARSDADIEVAARKYADAFDHLGQAFVAWLLVRIQTRATGAARTAEAGENAEATPGAGGQARAPETAAGNRVRANAARGAASEARVLEDLGLEKNYQAVYTAEGRAIPDALTDTLSVEIKDSSYVSLTQQLRIETEAARAAGRESVLVTGLETKVSGPASRAFDQIIRRPDLGPQ